MLQSALQPKWKKRIQGETVLQNIIYTYGITHHLMVGLFYPIRGVINTPNGDYQ
jgi:hypothetical protein